MRNRHTNVVARALASGFAFGLALTLLPIAASAQGKTYTMKISLPTLNDPSHVFAKNYAAALEKNPAAASSRRFFR